MVIANEIADLIAHGLEDSEIAEILDERKIDKTDLVGVIRKLMEEKAEEQP